MSEDKWNLPQTEEGLQQALRQIQDSRASGDDADLGFGLLALAHLVKWVRSDTNAGPFERSHELSLEALDVFRRAKHIRGQIKALISASAMAPPFGKNQFLDEAETLAQELGDERIHASLMTARARKLGLTDRAAAADLQRSALLVFRKLGDKVQQAHSLFSLAILDGSAKEKLEMALEAAEIHRELNDHSFASRCMFIAIMNAEELTPIVELEDMAKQGLDDAQRAMNHSQEGMWYGKLAHIAVAKGQMDEVTKYQRWAAELLESDGLAPLERWENDLENLKSFVALAKSQGNLELEQGLKVQLKELRANKPKS